MLRRDILAVLLALTFVIAPCAYAGKVEYPSLYPSPNGEYVNISSTDNSSFATASGNIGIGMSSGATVKLELPTNTTIKVGQAYFGNGGGNFARLSTNAYNLGAGWTETAAGTQFHVSGTDAQVWYHNGAGVWTQWANVNSTLGWTAGCTQALKQNIHALTFSDYALLREQFQATDLFSYNRKDIPTEPEVGFIAEHAPELILDKTKTQVPLIKGIGYLAAIMKAQENVLVPLEKDVQALKEEVLAAGAQQQQIDTLQKEVEELKKEFI